MTETHHCQFTFDGFSGFNRYYMTANSFDSKLRHYAGPPFNKEKSRRSAVSAESAKSAECNLAVMGFRF